MVDKLTFGCGQFLPGAGPFGFADYVPSPGVDGPTEPPPPPPSEECDDDQIYDPEFGCIDPPFCSDPDYEGQACGAPGEICVDGQCVDPCDGVTCDGFQTCVNGTCIGEDPCGGKQCCPEKPCPPGQVCNDDGNCITPPPEECNCYLTGAPTETVNFYETENNYCYRITNSFPQSCYTDVGAEIANPPFPPEFNSLLANGGIKSGQEGGPCPGGCPNSPEQEGFNFGCQSIIIRQFFCVPKFNANLQNNNINIGGIRVPAINGNVELNNQQIDAIQNNLTPTKSTEPPITTSIIPSEEIKFLQSIKSTFTKAVDFISSFSTYQKPSDYALEDYEVTVPRLKPINQFTQNTVGYKTILKDRIYKPINEILKVNDTYKDWDSVYVSMLSDTFIIRSLNPNFYGYFRSVLKPNGLQYTDSEIAGIIRSRIIENTLGDLNVEDLQNLSKKTTIYKKDQITASTNMDQNEVAVLGLVEQTMIPMSPTSPGITTKIMDNWKTFATDLDKYVEIEIGGVTEKYYLKDDDSVIEGVPSYLSDGDVLTVIIGGRRRQLPVKSEKSRAFILPEATRQQALPLVGGNPSRTLYVDVDTSANIEFNYSLNLSGESNRQNAYVFKLVPSATTKSSEDFATDIITVTDGKYELMDSTTEEGLAEINEYIKYKYNHRSVFLPHDDILFDYIEATSSLNMIQQDIIVPQSKENKDFPLLVRDYPWYLVVVPTNRSDYLAANGRSRIASYDVNGKTRRQVITSPLVAPDFTIQKITVFTRTNFSTQNINVYGKPDVQGRQTEFSLDLDIYKTVYKDSNGNLGRPSEIQLRRKKTGFRLIKEIMDELDTNYVLGSNAREKTIYANDLFDKLNITEYNSFFTLESGQYLYSLIKKGLFNDIRIVPTTRRESSALRISPRYKTKLIKRRSSASTIDKFPIIKSTNKGRYLENPNQTELYSSRFADRDQSDITSRAESSRIN